eukprot:COSAG01_NODE_4483_length_4984_cov_1.930194_4_plen_448_part_00
MRAATAWLLTVGATGDSDGDWSVHGLLICPALPCPACCLVQVVLPVTAPTDSELIELCRTIARRGGVEARCRREEEQPAEPDESGGGGGRGGGQRKPSRQPKSYFVMPLRGITSTDGVDGCGEAEGESGGYTRIGLYDDLVKALRQARQPQPQPLERRGPAGEDGALRPPPMPSLSFIPDLHELPMFVKEAVCNRAPKISEAEVDRRLSATPLGLQSGTKRAMFPYQLEAVRQGLRWGGKLLLADGMGLGKTLTSIALACCYRDVWPLLIICPATVKGQWCQELIRWAYINQNELLQLHSKKEIEALDLVKIRRPQVVVMTYAMAGSLSGHLDTLNRAALPPRRAASNPGQQERFYFKAAICDESHNLKNKSSRQSGAVKRLVAHAQCLQLLSGTPALSRPAELHPQVDLLIHNGLGSWRDFALRYCEGKETSYHLRDIMIMIRTLG